MNKADLINCLGDFCGLRDIADLNQLSLEQTYGFKKADIFVLFGGSILEGGEVLAEAIQNQIADTYIIVGGAGHTTEALRQIVQPKLKNLDISKLTEAEIFNHYIKEVHGLEADYLECHSTNCGNNITLLLDLIATNKLKCQSIILAQDATMQHRMAATLKKHASDELQIINYATYQVRVIEENGQFLFENQPLGMWDMDRYLTLLMGEIPRLGDDQNGYGPKGKNFISHVDISDEVNQAFKKLKSKFSTPVREANPLYASP